MPAERGRAALLDRRHDLELTQADMPGIGSAPVGSMAMKDVCDLQPGAAHRRLARPRVAASPRSMLRAGRAGWLRPGSSYWRRGCKAPWCRVWHGPEVSESREYRHLARGDGWRNCAAVCGDTRFLIPAAWAAARAARQSWRADSGSTGLRPGNSQPPGSSRLRRRPSRHQARSSSSSCGESIAWRSPAFARAGSCAPCRGRRATACARNRYRRP
jgi:hypothetical protein